MAGIKVNGYIKDIVRFTRIIPDRRAWIDAGKPKVDGSDPVAAFAGELHPGPIKVKITEVKNVSPSTKQFRLEPMPGYSLPFFCAGQFLSVKHEINGKRLTRPYSIVSSPRDASEGGYLEIALKKKPDGFCSEYVWDNWAAGTELLCDGAFGNMFFDGIRDKKHVVALAGGSGITPFRSIARDMLQGGRPEKMTILYGSCRRDDIIYKDDLEKLEKALDGRLKVVHVLSDDPAWEGEKGFLSAELIRRIIGDVSEVSFYMSGPQIMYEFVNKALDELGVTQRYRRLEAYGETDDITAHPDFPAAQVGKEYKLTLKYGITTVQLKCKSTETLLIALERAGYAVDSRCRSGECGWCRSLLIAGNIWYRPEGLAVRESDKSLGFVHVCSAYPMCDIVLRVQNQL
ncbi:MAG: 2Fe-2S iron-sulfur cluster binding domain-containing protein [Clostridia bacterium]|nr:2Fe-2S iron-sulfur cluster binding domain-containing protein [Clostridia bacterium]